MNVKDLTGPALHWAVARALKLNVIRCGAGPSQYLAYIPKGKRTYYKWEPTTNWKQAGPLIDQYIVNFWMHVKYQKSDPDCFTAVAMVPGIQDCAILCAVEGPTKLVACMRAIVAAHLGDEIELPKELQ